MPHKEMRERMSNGFLPMTREDLRERNIEQPDFVYVIGDAYVDHPSFGPAIISRVLEAHGYTVGIISQPDWKDPESVAVLGEPRLGFLVSSGNMDSMVNHYTVAKKHRKRDAYSPGGVMGKRPDRAVMVYCNLIRQRYRKAPIIAGGIEASLRRMAHYDYWSNSLRRSVLMDCGADLISYGMGERSILAIADALASGISAGDITFVDGTCFKTKQEDLLYDCVMLPSYEEMVEDHTAYAKSFYTQYTNTDPFSGKRMAERYGTVFVVQNPPAKPLTTEEMDEVYSLPYMRKEHPSYAKDGGIPAIEEIRFSLVSNRGCYGGCNFCALTFHQGRIIQVRSHESILEEARLMTEDPLFKGYIHDVGGPTANFRAPSCSKQMTRGVCRNRQCLFPKPCPNLEVDHSDYTALLRKLRALPKVKKVFVRSGIRFDYVMADPSDEFMEELVRYHISGQLKVAPEHVSDPVLNMLGKPEHSVYEAFVKRYERMNEKCGMNQFLVPYLMSSHPGCTMKDAVRLAEYLHRIHHIPEQVQDFYPTPSTLSTVMYFTGLDPRTMKPVYVPRSAHEKAMQRALMQYALPENRDLVEEALRIAGREDLIGYGPDCLIRPSGGGSTQGRYTNKRTERDRDAGTGTGTAGRRDGNIKGAAKQAAGRRDGNTKGAAKHAAGRGVNDKGYEAQAQKKRRAIRNVHKKKGQGS